MERNYNNREFEQFVKKNADQYRMIPSDKVWKGINNTLHTRRRWYGIGLVSLLTLTAISVTWVMLNYPNARQQQVITMAVTPQQITPAETPKEPANPAQKNIKQPEDITRILSPNSFDEPATPASEAMTVETVSDFVVIDGNASNLIVAPPAVNEKTVVMNETMSLPEPGTAPVKKQSALKVNTAEIAGLEPEVKGAVSETNEKPATAFRLPLKTASSSEPSIYYPLTIESVVNSYKPNKFRKKLSWQIFITPTFSYRRLKANKQYDVFANPISYPFSSLTDVNKAVTHKPDMGLELGFDTRYPLSRKVRLRGGLQFNINRYDIRAYSSSGEQATINLNGDNNVVTAWTYYRNYNGYRSDWLKNFYFSVSAPIGLEYTLLGNRKKSWGVAGTVQPTYILREKAFLISTDYKNYAKVPGLVRDWNVNTSFETFINFTTPGLTRWQIGPQVRYQVLSSFHDRYPVRENLFDFGLKIGLTLNQ